jgi:hypothetical protein
VISRGPWIALIRRLTLTLCAAGLLASPLLAAESEMLLSWRAPFGQPRATSTVVAACKDTGRVDTLYLSFRVGRLRPGLARMSGTVTFSPQPGDTLQPFWFFKTGWPNGGNMFIDFPPFGDVACTPPWPEGSGEVRYDHRSGRGRLDIFYALMPHVAQSLEPDVRYCFARIRILHRRAGLAGCRQPICIEWASARLGFTTGREMDLSGGSGHFVTWNRSGGCGAPLRDPLTRPWQPRPAGSPPR